MPERSIAIHRMIVHKVDHVNNTEPQYSDLASPITEEIRTFLIKQICESREHKNARSGVFLTQEPGNLSLEVLCDGLMEDPEAFVDYSKQVAGHLFECIRNDKRITTSDLVILTFSEEDEGYTWAAILKMDQHSGFVGEIQDVEGKSQIVLRPVQSVLTNNDLQKCAFVLPKSQRTQTRHLIVLDQQVPRFGARLIAASFFVTRFLQSDIGGNARAKTDIFYWSSLTWLDSKRGQWSDSRLEQFESRINDVLSEPRIDVDMIARTMIQDEQEQDEYILFIRQKLQEKGFDDLVFESDSSLALDRQYVYFEGDNGLKIRVQAEGFGRGKTLFYEEDQATGEIIIRINTTTFRRTRR